MTSRLVSPPARSHAHTAVRHDGRLLPPRDVRAVLREGAGAHGSAMAVRLGRGGDEGIRGTVIASRKIGGAVVRNRAKRRLREALRLMDLPEGTEVVVVARSGALTTPFEGLVDELRALVSRAAAQLQGGTG